MPPVPLPNGPGWMGKRKRQHTHQPRAFYSPSFVVIPFAWGFIFELVSSGKKKKKQEPDVNKKS